MTESGISSEPEAESIPLGTFLESLGRLPRATWLEAVRVDQSQRWRSSACVPVEEYLDGLAELQFDSEDRLVLICGEVHLRRELEQQPTLEEYQLRFPDLANELALQFELDRLFSTPRSDATLDFPHGDNPDASNGFAGYELCGELGRGAAGIVYRAWQGSLGRIVAIKVLSGTGGDERRLRRQRREIEALALLRHPNVVHIYDVFEHDGRLHLVMEFVDGSTLKRWTKGKPLKAREAAGLVKTLAETIEQIHEAGVLHRDLKPSNVLVTVGGQLKVTDFGLAKLIHGAQDLSTEDGVLGTPSYMAPEQAGGKFGSAGPQCDIYSLGAILYELLTGRPPFLGATVLETLSQVISREPVSPRQLVASTPRDLQTICLKCLSKPPSRRYQRARELAEDLQRFLAGEPVRARPIGPLERSVRLVRRNPAAATAIAVFTLLLLFVGAALWTHHRQQKVFSAQLLVETIGTADPQIVPRLLERLPQHGAEGASVLRSALATAQPATPAWVNLSVAAVWSDPSVNPEALVNYLPSSQLAEIGQIVHALTVRTDVAPKRLWQAMLNLRAVDAQLRVACLLAAVAPEDPRWRSISLPVARELVRQHPLDVGRLTSMLKPAHKALTPVLLTVSRETDIDSLSRKTAIGVLARFASDDLPTLVELICDADASEFRMLIKPLQRQREAALSRLNDVVSTAAGVQQIATDSTASAHDVERAHDAAQRRRATAAIAMWHLGRRDVVLGGLSGEAEPSFRTSLIELLAPLGVSAESLWLNLQTATQASVRQALVLALGQVDWELERKPTTGIGVGLLDIYNHEVDAGVHSAAEWLLRHRLNESDAVDRIDAALRASTRDGAKPEDTTRRNWYLGPNGHTFSIVTKVGAFTMGSPPTQLWREPDELQHQRVLDYSFAISTKEVTASQFLQFRDKGFSPRYSPTSDCPINNVSWYEAVAYCRWLSEKEGLPESQMCYPPVEEIKPGMRLPENWLARKGYRLPTEVEWECACRAGTVSARFHGEGVELLRAYAWFLGNSDDRAWPVGLLKPNNLGLFDVLGNVAERCHDVHVEYPSPLTFSEAARNISAQVVEGTELRDRRGASFGDVGQNVRSARRYGMRNEAQWGDTGFRVARTW